MKPGDLRFSHKVGVTFGHERRSNGLSQTCLISGPIILLQFGDGGSKKDNNTIFDKMWKVLTSRGIAFISPGMLQSCTFDDEQI